MSSSHSSPDALRAASAFLQRADIAQTFATQDGNTSSYTQDELNAILKKENFLQGENKQSVLMVSTANGFVPVSPQIVKGLQALASVDCDVPMVNVLANTVIDDGTQGDRQIASLSQHDLAQIEKDTSRTLGIFETGLTLRQLSSRAMDNLNQFLNPNGTKIFRSVKQFDLTNQDSPYSRIKDKLGDQPASTQGGDSKTTTDSSTNDKDASNDTSGSTPQTSHSQRDARGGKINNPPVNNTALTQQADAIIRQAEQEARKAATQFKATPPTKKPGTGSSWDQQQTLIYSPDFMKAYENLQVAGQLVWQVEQLFSQQQTPTEDNLALANQLLKAAEKATREGKALAKTLPDDDPQKVTSLNNNFDDLRTRLDTVVDTYNKVNKAVSLDRQSQRKKYSNDTRDGNNSDGGLQLSAPSTGTVVGGTLGLAAAVPAYSAGMAMLPTLAAIPSIAGAVVAAPWLVGGLAAVGTVAGGLWLGNQIDHWLNKS